MQAFMHLFECNTKNNNNENMSIINEAVKG